MTVTGVKLVVPSPTNASANATVFDAPSVQLFSP
jgi:hypothetical protein